MKDEEKFTWTDLGKGILGGAIGGVIEMVGIGAATLIRAPKATYKAVRALWKTQELGPVLKTTSTPLVLVGGVVAVPLSVVAGAFYGIVEGFVNAVDKNPLAVPKIAFDHIRRYHTEMVDEAIQNITEWSDRPPKHYFEIRVLEGIRGLLCGAFGAVVTCLGATLSTVVNWPGALVRVTHTLWSAGSLAMLPFLVGAQVLVVVVLVLGPLLVVGLTFLAGLSLGTARGYKRGFREALQCFDDVGKYHDMLVKAIY